MYLLYNIFIYLFVYMVQNIVLSRNQYYQFGIVFTESIYKYYIIGIVLKIIVLIFMFHPIISITTLVQ